MKKDTTENSIENLTGGEVSAEEFVEFDQNPGPSQVALRLRTLKSSVLRAAETRRRLPQPLFWSLFHVELCEIKKRKARERVLQQIS